MYKSKNTSFVKIEDLMKLTLDIPNKMGYLDTTIFIKNRIDDDYAIDSSLYYISFISNVSNKNQIDIYLVEKSKIDNTKFDILLPQDIYLEYKDKLSKLPKSANFLYVPNQKSLLSLENLIYLLPIVVVILLLIWWWSILNDINNKSIDISKLQNKILNIEKTIVNYEEDYKVNLEQLEKLRDEYERIK